MALRTASSADEYNQLRGEQTSLSSSVRTLIGTILTAYFAVPGVVLGTVVRLDNVDFALKHSVAEWTATVMITLTWVGLFLTRDWLVHSYRVGSYILAFHEEPKLVAGKEVAWICRSRSAELKEPVLRRQGPARIALTYFALSVLAFAIGVVAIPATWGRLFVRPWNPASIISSTALLVALALSFRLKGVHKLQMAMTEAWQRIARSEISKSLEGQMGKVFRKQIFVCTTEGEGRCAPKGGLEVLRKFREEVKARGLADILVTKVGCTGQHPTGPTVIVHPDGLWYRTVKPEDVPEIIEKHLVGGQPVERLINSEMQVKP